MARQRNRETKEERVQRRLEAIDSKDELSLDDVYELGLEHDQENLRPRSPKRTAKEDALPKVNPRRR